MPGGVGATTGITCRRRPRRAACFSLAGHADDARRRADDLGVPLFVLDLTGTPRAVNDVADQLDASGA